MTIQFTKINRDINGNPRVVFHFLELSNNYDEALKIAKKIGGRKFHNKQFDGGIAVQCYNLEDLEKDILELKKN
jgi:hypothetical protein